jgi:hypothetical protein
VERVIRGRRRGGAGGEGSLCDEGGDGAEAVGEDDGPDGGHDDGEYPLQVRHGPDVPVAHGAAPSAPQPERPADLSRSMFPLAHRISLAQPR